MLVGSICGPEQYQSVVIKYADRHFPSHSPMYLISLLISNQAEKTFINKDSLNTTMIHSQSIDNPNSISLGSNKSLSVQSLWRRNLAAIIANKSSDWNKLVCSIGDKLLHESHDIMAAHFSYMCGGILPSAPGGKSKAGRYALLGCDSTKPRHRALSDCISVSSLRMTEVYEWTIINSNKKTKLLQQQKKQAASDASSSLSGMFAGMLGGNKVVVPESSQDDKFIGDVVSDEEIMCMKIALCPLKVRFATTIADLGYLNEAASYALEAKALVQLCNAPTQPPKKNNNLPGIKQDNSRKSFGKSFVTALDEFIDRLQIPVKQVNSAGGNQANVKESGGMWGVGSLLNAMTSNNLKDFVDGLSTNNATNTTPTHGQTTIKLSIKPSLSPQTISYIPSKQGDYDNNPFGGPSLDHRQANGSQSPMNDPCSGNNNNNQQQFNSTNNNQQQQYSNYQNTSKGQYPSNIDQFSPQQNLFPSSNNLNQFPPSNQDQFLQKSNQFLPNQGQFNSPKVDQFPSNNNNTQNQGYFNSSSINNINQLNPNNNNNNNHNHSSPNPVAPLQAKNKPVVKLSNIAPVEEATGIASKVRKGLLSYLYPDAHDTTENMGKEMKAYFDKSTGKWVFPDEVLLYYSYI